MRLVNFDFQSITARKCQLSIISQLVIPTFKKVLEKREHFEKIQSCMEKIANEIALFLKKLCEKNTRQTAKFLAKLIFAAQNISTKLYFSFVSALK